MTEYAFEFLELARHPSGAEPRRTGQTMVMDVGFGPDALRDQLRVVGPYIDLAKFVVGSARLHPRDVLIEKLGIYEQHDIRPFLGGQFLEYVMERHGMPMVPRFLEEALDLGFGAFEVSDNCVDFTDDRRRDLIELGTSAGLHVHGEVGSKLDRAEVSELVRQAELMLEAGCDLVLFEAAELVDDGRADERKVSAIRDSISPERTMVELPGPWIKGVSLNDVYEMMKTILRVFGPEANIGNVAMSEVLELACSRRGLGTSGPQLGAGALSGEYVRGA